jgi:hypothetical protein
MYNPYIGPPWSGSALDPYYPEFLLDLSLTWDGARSFRPEPGYWTDYIPGMQNEIVITPLRQGLFGLNMGLTWYTEPAYGGSGVYPLSVVKHVRFANPLLIET